jgi:hypothetical protein
LVIPQLQPGDDVIPQLVNILQTVKGWGAFSTFISPKISRFLKNNLSPGIGGAPSPKLYLKNGTVEIFFQIVGMDSSGPNNPESVVYLTTIYPPV